MPRPPVGPAARRAAGPSPFPFELAAAGVLAAGVLMALRRRRREQLWRRTPGRRLTGPQPDAALAEAALRDGAADHAVRLLDDGLRELGQELAARGRLLPAVFAAHLGAGTADLWISPPDQEPPPPWTAVDQGQVWRLPLDAAPRPDLGHLAPAPYPGLVSIGADATGEVLVDLAARPGLIAVAGPDRLVRASLAAIAAELATSVLADQLRVTLAGMGAELVALAPDRIRAARTFAEALAGLEAEAGGGAAGRRAPRILVTALTPSRAERERLLQLARAGCPVTCLAAGPVAEAEQAWEMTGEGRLRVGRLGLDVRANLLLPEQRAAVVDLFHAAGQWDGVGLGPPAEPADAGDPAGPGEPGLVEPATTADPALTPEHALAGGPGVLPGFGPTAEAGALPGPKADAEPIARGPVEITLLGPVCVRAPGEIEPDRMAIAAELVVYLAVHPGGVHPNVLTGAIWPRGVTPQVADAVVGRVRHWLGADGIGRPHLATDAGGRLRLGSQVRVDWRRCQSLLARAEGESERDRLAEALALVKGPFLDGRPQGRYGWLAVAGLEFEVEARVADAAHRLAELLFDDGDPAGAVRALRTGLSLARDDEVLWRDLLTAAHATGDEGLLRAVVAEVSAKAANDEVLPRLAPQTEALLDELLPSWRADPG